MSDAQRALRGHDPPPPLRGARARASATASRCVYVDLDELPGLLGGRLVARRPGLVRFRRADYLGDPACRSPTPCARSSRGAPAPTPAARSGSSPSRARSGTASTRSASTTASRPGGERLEAVVAEVTNTPWGERHAYVLPRGGDGPVLDGELRQGAPRLAVHGHGPALRVAGDRAPARRSRCTSRAPRHGAPAFDATLSLRRRTAHAPLAGAACCRATRRRRCASSALIYGHAAALWLRARPRPSPPGGGRADDRARRPRHRPRGPARRLHTGELTIVEGGERHVFGAAAFRAATVEVHASASGPRCCTAAAAWPSRTPRACGTRPTSPP